MIIPLVIGAALLLVFCLYALRKGEPLADIRLLARRPVASSSAVLFFSGFALYGAMLLLPLFYQEARGATALSAGVMLIPQGIGALLCRGVVGRLTDRIGARPIAVVGFVVVAASTIPFCLADPQTNSWLLGLWLLVRGVGLGTVTIPVMAVAYLGLDKAEIAHASVLTRTAQQIGGSFGTAVLAVILESSVAAQPRGPRPRLPRRLLVGGRLRRARRPALDLAAGAAGRGPRPGDGRAGSGAGGSWDRSAGPLARSSAVAAPAGSRPRYGPGGHRHR